ncbi:3-oxoadipate enol-lactonase [Acidihalobacter prosperus]|uniref:3-oxoadipate enol-lactonase n=1 Tax=Acidihalobacter prosperus TaxID=160660 RepID=A0A1A6C8U6_9GAMM|nr:3-oxoadipate enol-lactonase [Acidihalobacter prosperus]OBS10969.1 3-oxoadipate enol-lactonase [Acidihalobacter prosperus]
MPSTEIDELRLHYRLEGPVDAPVLVLSNSLGAALEMWQPQMAALSERFRVLRYDTRGHGRSSVPPGPYSIERLGHDVLGLLDALDIERAHFCGLSMGGMTGIWLGIHAAERLERLVLCNTAARLGDADGWNARIREVGEGGMNALVGATMERWFTAAFRAHARAECTAIQAMFNATDPAGYAACCAAIRDMDQRAGLGRIGTPTLLIGGEQDPVTPPECTHELVAAIPGASLAMLDAAHLSNVEAAAAFTRSVIEFLHA